MKPVVNNYEIMFKRAEQEFLKYDQEKMIRGCGLRADEEYIYITFFYAPYRIDRKTGYAERRVGENSWRHCNYSEGMGIFDLICDPTPYRQLSGEMVDNSYFAKVGVPGGRSMFQDYADRFCENLEKFNEVCLAMGAEPWGKSDAGFKFEITRFFPMVLLLWEGEEGIPAAMSVLWDKNMTDFLHFETAQFIIGHVLEEINTAIGLESIYSAAAHYEK